MYSSNEHTEKNLSIFYSLFHLDSDFQYATRNYKNTNIFKCYDDKFRVMTLTPVIKFINPFLENVPFPFVLLG